jgi:redox-sensitive bicupin YhaK (pirin superfamily)
MLAPKLQTSVREVVYRTRGHGQGPITRLMSPGDAGELVKPFVFLDLAGFDGRFAPPPMDYLWHPHSGIATVTVMLEGGIRFAETTGREGSLPMGGVEWMRASGGVWHTGGPLPGRTRVFQLWVALPPELENAANDSNYVLPRDVPAEGPVRVILGDYGKLKSPIASPPMTYLHVRLQPGQRWTYQPAPGHTVGWVAVDEGVLRTPATAIPAGELAIFAPSEEPLDFVVEENTSFVLGSAARHPHDLVLGNYSVHTSVEALNQGEAEIRRIGRPLQAKRRIPQ